MTAADSFVVQVTFQLRAKVTEEVSAMIDVQRFKDILEIATTLTGDEFEWITPVSSKVEMIK